MGCFCYLTRSTARAIAVRDAIDSEELRFVIGRWLRIAPWLNP